MLTRLEQICLKEELLEDSAVSDASLYVAANAAYSVIDPQTTFDLQTYERQIRRDTLTPLRGLTGIQMGMMKFSLEMAGTLTTDGSVYPEWDLPLRACGFMRERLVKLTVGTITGGPFRHGEIITQTTSGATGIVWGDTYTGQTSLYVAQEHRYGHTGTGSITAFTTTSGHTLTGSSSGATAAEPSAVAGTVTTQSISTPAAIGYAPISYAVQAILTNASGVIAAITDGEVLHQESTNSFWIAFGSYSALSGNQTVYLRRLIGYSAVFGMTNTEREFKNVAGTVVMRGNGLATNEAQYRIPSLSMGGLYDGVREAISGARGTVRLRCPIGEPAIMEFEFKGKKKSFQDGGLVSGVSNIQALPPVILDADFSVAADGTTFAAEPTPNVAEIAFDMGVEVNYRKSIDQATGLLESYVAGRKGTFTMDPEMMPEGFFSWMANYTGNTNMRSRFRVGTTLGNRFRILNPGLAITSAGQGDRDGIKTRQIQGTLTSGSQSTSTVNRENELIIIWELL